MPLQLEKGRPLNTAGRLNKEIRVYDLLDSLNVEYDRVDHAPAMTMEVCREIDEALQATICKNLFLCNRQKTRFYLLMIPDNKVFKTKEISAQIGSSRLSFAEAAFMERYLDITPGSVSVMGLMNDREGNVRLLVDGEALQGEYVGCHPCVNTSSLRIRTKDVFEVFVPHTGHDITVVSLRGENA